MKLSRLFLLVLASCLLPATVRAQTAPRPNIIFILCDDLGYGDIGTLFQTQRATTADRSQPWHFTPQLDTLAAQGLRLPHHYCPAPVCAPSRASLLLGVHQGHANVRDNQFDKALENNHTIASMLKLAGYRTASIGKWGLQGSGGSPALWPAYPTKRGFDYYYGYAGHGDGHEHYPKEGIYRGAKNVWDNDTEVSAGLDKCYTTDLFTARAKKWMVDHLAASPQQPFFLYLAHDTPHAVLELPTQAYPAGSGLTGGLQWNGSAGSMINTASGTPDSYYHPDYAAATWDHDANAATAEQPWPDVYKRYATSVRRIDDTVGDLIQTLKDLAVDTNTLIVFTTDNGASKESYLAEAYDPTFFDSYGPFDGIKRDCWEGGVRVGALVRWPAGITAGRTSTLPCQFHDWLPTFADLAGITPPARTDGVSLRPTLTNSGTQRPPTVYVEYFEGGTTPNYTDFQSTKRNRRRNQMQMIRSGDFSGVRYNVAAASDNFEIYNVVSNPKQTTNLAASQAALQQQMKDAVLRLRRPGAGVTRPYDAEPIPPVNPSPVTGGVSWKVYEQSHGYVAELTTLTPDQTGNTSRPDVSVRTRDQDIAILFQGYLQIPADGTYTLYLNADTRAHLRLHEASLIDADRGYTPGSEISAAVPLKAGRHPYRLYYSRQTTGSPSLSLQWSGPGITKQPIPDTAFIRDGTGGGNLPPTAAPDRVKTSQNTALPIQPLANDSDDGQPQPLSLVSFTQPKAGTVQQAGDTLNYTPRTGFLGEDTFHYTITDGTTQSSAAVTIIVGSSDDHFWFPLDETSGTTATEIGGLKTATLAGFTANPAQWVTGKSGSALEFDGTDDVASIDSFTGILGTSPRTISAWVKTNATGGNRPIVAWGPNSNGNKWTFLMNTAGQIRVEVTSGLVVGTRSINNGQWRHVACTFSGTNVTDVKLYVDGTLETVSATTPLSINTTGTFNVKIGSDVQNRFWLGTLDDVRIYRRALSAAEIAALAAGKNQTSDAWHRRYYGPAPVDWATDSDGDGLSALIEMALASQPHCPDLPLSYTMSQSDENTWQVSLRHRSSTWGLTSRVEHSTNLHQWLPATVESTTPDGSDGTMSNTTWTFDRFPLRQYCRFVAVFDFPTP